MLSREQLFKGTHTRLIRSQTCIAVATKRKFLTLRSLELDIPHSLNRKFCMYTLYTIQRNIRNTSFSQKWSYLWEQKITFPYCGNQLLLNDFEACSDPPSPEKGVKIIWDQGCVLTIILQKGGKSRTEKKSIDNCLLGLDRVTKERNSELSF